MDDDSTTPAAFRQRIAAAALDYLVIGAWVALVTVVGVASRALAPGLMDSLFADPSRGELTGFALLTLPVGLYFIVSEATSGATWGKRRIGLAVSSAAGGRIGMGRSIARTALKLLPWELSHFAVWQLSSGPAAPGVPIYVVLALAWLLVIANVVSAVFERRGRSLYDLATGTVVVRRSMHR